MCDTLVATGDAATEGVTVFAKNSDREPGEAQAVEALPPRSGGCRIRLTHLEVDDVERTYAVIVSRPAWMWGAEMGVNERGVAIGNEAVFTRVPLDGLLTGMDLLRLALERAASAREAIEWMIALVREHGQGGRMGHRNATFSYSSSVIVADPGESWVFETAGRFFAAQRVRGARSISNALSIGTQMDLVDDRALAFASSKGWTRGAADFDFARCFSATAMTALAGARARRNCTTRALAAGRASLATMQAALRDHAGRSPLAGLRMSMPCSHASWIPTRHAAQTTGSLVARLTPGALPEAWLTGTSSPCISVFKRVRFGESPAGGSAPERADPRALWWGHEAVHRALMRTRWRAADAVVAEARALEAAGAGWEAHRDALPRLLALAQSGSRGLGLSRWYWDRQNRSDGLTA